MKSEKAKQRLYESFTFNSNIGIDRKAAIEAVELAEQEDEERMRRKAIEAFGEGCFCDDKGALCGTCSIQEDFIQKLTENEND